jgi:hypothetical protein
VPVVVESTPVLNAAQQQVPAAAQVPNAAWVPNAARWQVPTTPQDPTAAQVPTAAQEALNNDSEMWNMFLDEVKEEDSRITDAWKEDASSILVFVSLINNLLIVSINDKVQDGSFLRNCRRVHHRILQEVVHRFWQSDCGSSSADFTATSQLPKYRQFQHGESAITSWSSHGLGQHTVVDKPRTEPYVRLDCDATSTMGT